MISCGSRLTSDARLEHDGTGKKKTVRSLFSGSQLLLHTRLVAISGLLPPFTSTTTNMLHQYDFDDPFLAGARPGDLFMSSPYEYEYRRRREAERLRLLAERRRQQEAQLRHQAALRERRLAREEQLRQEQRMREAEKAQRQGYNIVRGWDGNLYRVPVVHPHVMPKRAPPVSYEIVRGPDGNYYRIPNETPTFEDTDDVIRGRDGLLYGVHRRPDLNDSHLVRGRDGRIYRSSHITNTSEMTDPSQCSSFDDEAVPNKKEEAHLEVPVTVLQPDSNNETASTLSPKKESTHIIVEDASDSEDEDDMNSAIRHRIPSPGESWMEPVHVPEEILNGIGK